MLHLCELTEGLHEQRPVVELARPGVYLAAYHFVVHAQVTADVHVVDGERTTFEYFDFEIDRVVPDHDFRRFDHRHQIAVVLVE